MIDEIYQKITSKANILDAITWTSKAWDQVKTKTIVNWFSHCGFSVNDATTSSVEEAALEETVNLPLKELNDLLQSRKKLKSINATELVDKDKYLAKTEIFSGSNWEEQLLKEYQEEQNEQNFSSCEPWLIEAEVAASKENTKFNFSVKWTFHSLNTKAFSGPCSI